LEAAEASLLVAATWLVRFPALLSAAAAAFSCFSSRPSVRSTSPE